MALATDQQTILRLLRAALQAEGSETFSCTSGRDEFNRVIGDAILKNSILPTVYQKLPEELKKQLSSRYFAALKQSVVQEHEGTEVLRALSEAGLDCIALKGWELRKLYPDPTMRQMADLDILVRPYDYKRIRAVMESLGFSSGTKSSWKYDSFKKDEVHVEMHKRLTDDSGVIQAREKGIWERASTADSASGSGGASETDGTAESNRNIYRMSPEDFAVFHFVHLHKDFMNGSLGLRRIADT